MPPTINATAGDPGANSYCLTTEADDYFSNYRLPLNPPWPLAGAGNSIIALIMATNVLNALSQPFKTLMPPQNGQPAYYRIRRQWKGTPASTTQVLWFPCNGLFDTLGNALDPTVIPEALKQATAEFAGQLLIGDRTLDNPVIVQGLTNLRAGPVSLTFKPNVVPQVLPDAVLNLIPVHWLTEERYELANRAEFEVVSRGSRSRFGREEWW